MRWCAMAMFAMFLSACGLADKLPQGPVVTPWDRLQQWGPPERSGATYTSEPAVAFPVLPVIGWGAAYDVDIVVVSRHPDWDMHEYALLSTPRGPVWLVKEARAGSLDQSIVADLPDIGEWLPELPLKRRYYPVKVDDRSTAERMDVRLSYENIDGVPVVAHFWGKPPVDPVPKRNGSTMGHSRNQVMAVLDLPYRGLGNASLEIGGKKYRPKRILGLVPFAMTLVQTQSGLATGRFSQGPGAANGAAEAAFHTVHAVPGGGDVPRDWRIERSEGHVDVVQESELRTLQYRFLSDGDTLELAAITAFQWGRASPVLNIDLQPALPDLRRRFEGVRRSRFVLDVNGQQGHAIGTLEAWWEADGPRVRLLPEEPWWVADRPMLTTIAFEGGRAEVRIERIDSEQTSGAGAKATSPR